MSWHRAVANRVALAALVASVLSVFAVIQIPALARLLHLVPLHGSDWLLVCALSLVPAIVGQAVKIAYQWRRGNGAAV